MSGGARADPRRLLRLPPDVEPYPAEPSDEELAEELGLPAERVVRFDMNTLGGGPLPGVVAALAAYPAGRVVEYGDQAYRALRAAVSTATGAPGLRVIPGAGADELIRLVTTAAVGQGDRVVIPTPTFPMFEVEARLAGATVRSVPRREPATRQAVDEILDAARGSGARLVWLCSPNNPTGDRFPADEIAALAGELQIMGTLLVVDAVYQELAEASEGLGPEALSLLQLQDRHANLVILRSLAKAYGLAGARVGYLVVPLQLAATFDAARLPLSVSGPSEAAALGALSDPAAARERHASIVAERGRIAGELAGRGWEALPSVTNFVLLRPPRTGATAAELGEALLARGLVVRTYPGGPLRDWLRITARAAVENDRLLAALDELD